MTKPDLANHVRIYTGRLFYDGSYTDEQRWVKAEAYEALLSRLSAEPRAESHIIDAFLAMALPRIWELREADPGDGTPEGRELVLLAELAERYQKWIGLPEKQRRWLILLCDGLRHLVPGEPDPKRESVL